MNDVGTGYSSLSYLRRCSFDRIKIDQSFVRDMGSKQDCGAIIRAVVGLSSELGAATTGRGGETRGQLDALTPGRLYRSPGLSVHPAAPAEAASELVRIAATLRRRSALAEPEQAA
jgi:EAL domain-containing protein (putative c-di-GMP-specific phosphodiesterase class I)